MASSARNYCVACNDVSGAKTQHDSAKCCLRCRNFSFADKEASEMPRNLFLKAMETRPTITDVEKLKFLALAITGNLKTPTDKARAIFTWISKNITYTDGSPLFNPVDILEHGTCVCKGFASLYFMLALSINLPCDMIAGASKTARFVDIYSGPKPITPDLAHEAANHAWNVVQIDGGELKLIDCTWGSNGEIQIPGSADTVNYCFFTMSNDEFLLQHFPTVDNQIHVNQNVPAGFSKPDWSFLAPVDMHQVEANYPQWATASEPPNILNTDKIDIVDGLALQPRRKLVTLSREDIVWSTDAKSFKFHGDDDVQVRGVPADTVRDPNTVISINAFVFKVPLACNHLRIRPGLFLKVVKGVSTFPVNPGVRYVVHERDLLDRIVENVQGEDGRARKLISLQAQLPVYGLVTIVQWELA